jgi:TolB-like protein
MTRMFSKLVGVMLVGMSSTMIASTGALADVPATVPAVVNQAVPPGGPVAPAPRSAPRVEVFPFTAVAGQPAVGQDWTGRGIQENLQSDVSHTGATLLMAPHILGANDDPIAIAKQNHADLVVTGTYQIVGDQIRANGQLIDVATNTPVGGFSATGSQHDLFKVEDALGEQLRGLLPRPIPLAQLQQQFEQPQNAPTVVYQPQTDYTSTAVPTVSNTYYDSSPVPTYYYPDYSYGYPYDYGYYGGDYYGGFGFFPGFVSVGIGRDHGFRGRDGFHDHGFVGGGRGGITVGNPGFRGSGGGGVRSPAGSVGVRGGFGGGGFVAGRTGGGFGGGGGMGGGAHGGGGGGHR